MIKEAIGDAATQTGIERKVISKLAKTMYKHNYTSLQEENRHFETLYETLIEGKLRDPLDAEGEDK